MAVPLRTPLPSPSFLLPLFSIVSGPVHEWLKKINTKIYPFLSADGISPPTQVTHPW
jgi:hypothetical protein